MPGPSCDSCKDTCGSGDKCGDNCKCGGDCKCCSKTDTGDKCGCKAGGKCLCPEGSCACK